MKLVIGLGNNGTEYENNRHNVGKILLDHLSKKYHLSFDHSQKVSADVARYDDLTLCKPVCFMNESGSVVSSLSNFYKVSAENIIIIHDDLDLAFGRIKVQLGGHSAGHHGIEDITEKLGTDQYTRVRVGIGRPEIKGTEANYVLSDFTQEQLGFLENLDILEYVRD